MSKSEIKSGRPKRETNPFTNIFRDLITGLTQQQAAEKIGVARQNIGRWTSGETTPDIETLTKIAIAFNVSTDYLLGRTPNKTTNENLRAVCDYTGLSEKAAEFLHTLQKRANGEELSEIYMNEIEDYMKENYDLPEDEMSEDLDEIKLSCSKENQRILQAISTLFSSDGCEVFVKNLMLFLYSNFEYIGAFYRTSHKFPQFILSAHDVESNCRSETPISYNILSGALLIEIQQYIASIKPDKPLYIASDIYDNERS